MKKRILSILCTGLIVTSLVGCKNTNTDTKKNDSNATVEYTKVEDLPKENTSFEYAADGTIVKKNFKEDSNYKAISEVVNNFSKGLFTVDYNDDKTFFKFRDYLCSEALKLQNDSEDQKTIDKFKQDKVQSDFVKTNLDKVVYDSSINNYLVECTVYTYVKNDPSVSIQNRYYQNKIYYKVEKENDKWVILSWLVYNSVLAEETPSSPTIYMLDTSENKSTYISEKDLSKMKDLESVKDIISSYFNKFLSIKYQSAGSFKDEQLKYIAKDEQQSFANGFKETSDYYVKNRLDGTFKNINFDLIDYSSFNNEYYVEVSIEYSLSNGKSYRTNSKISLLNEDNTWKVYSAKIFRNPILISQTDK
ncbi:hypothetical protein [Clostridium sp. 'White wine YQ']|uniref:hypothetical protein n=1 Tax=Clostridium sp. 'White wine YQ' TaxID=3027474 RepID=UPI0023668CFA|nr:hypothetical protein [Clostridium sp. 'White wine YQ']MDD7793711.1 hypothetical protein [Clostridium sp. 'White wine YQ']